MVEPQSPAAGETHCVRSSGVIHGREWQGMGVEMRDYDYDGIKDVSAIFLPTERSL